MKNKTLIRLSIIVILCILFISNSNAQRKWWVYLSPAEGVNLYNAAFFNELKTQADNYVSTGITNPIGKISHNEMWVIEMGNALETVSAVFFARKYGEYGGTYNSELDNYRTFLVNCWRRMILEGPWSTFVIYNADSPDWYCADIALRTWISGGWASYDAIRDDLSTTDRTDIDAWYSGYADHLWNSPESEYMVRNTNRPLSMMAQSNIIALVMQDQIREDSYFNATKFGRSKYNRAFLNIIDNYNWGFRAGCENYFTLQYGLPEEMYRSDSWHGINAVAHAFQGMMNMTHAARNGGSASWDMLNPVTQNQANLKKMTDFWYDATFGSLLPAYLEYTHCLENSTGYGAFLYEPVKGLMKKNIGYSFAYLDSRFETADWGEFKALTPTYRDFYDNTKQKLYKFRANQLRNTPVNFGTTSLPALPVNSLNGLVEFFDLKGQLINRKIINNQGFNIPDLQMPKGIYLLKNNNHVQKFVVQ